MSLRLTLLTTLAFAAAAAPAGAVQVGIADQKSDMWADQRFKDLGIRYARIGVPWDVLRSTEGRDALGFWLDAAKAEGAAPLVTFERSRVRPSYNPSPGELAKQLKAIRRNWPWVNEFATWNEANLSKKPELVAKWWLALRRACPYCRVLAADLVDRKNAPAFTKRFAKAAKRQPGIWGLHNYADANRFTTSATKRFVKAVKGSVWLTETGGVVSRRNGSGVRFAGSGPEHAARATRFLFDRLARVSSRIKRIYIYHWNTPEGSAETWDSGLIGPDGQERPALSVLRDVLGVSAG
jgi:hypothetical protein